MKKHLLASLFLIVFGVSSQAQITIKEAAISFKLPNSKWYEFSKASNRTNSIYIYKKKAKKVSKGVYVRGKLTIVTETLQDTVAIEDFSKIKNFETPFTIVDTFTYEDENSNMYLSNAIGYRGYTYKEKIKYGLYVIHVINGNRGVQLFLDVPEEVFKKYDRDFIKIMQSFKTI